MATAKAAPKSTASAPSAMREVKAGRRIELGRIRILGIVGISYERSFLRVHLGSGEAAPKDCPPEDKIRLDTGLFAIRLEVNASPLDEEKERHHERIRWARTVADLSFSTPTRFIPAYPVPGAGRL
jgi:hypothetical protein